MSANPPQRSSSKLAADGKSSAPPPKTKKDKLITLLRRRGGQDIAQLTDALGWLPHTVRAALTGLRKSGLNVERHVTDDGRTCYRIVPEASR